MKRWTARWLQLLKWGAAFAMLAVAPANAQTWLGTDGYLWPDSANWSSGTVPNSPTADVVFGPANTGGPYFDSVYLTGSSYDTTSDPFAATVRSLTFANSTGLIYALYGGSLSVTGSITSAGTTSVGITTPISMAGATLALNASVANSGQIQLSGGLSGSGALLVQSGNYFISGNTDAFTGGIHVLSSGTLTASTAFANSSGITVDSGGTLNVGSSLTKDITVSGTGVTGTGALFGISAATLSGTTTLAGDTMIGGNNSALTITGDITGNYSLTIAGSLTLVGAKSYSGDTIISGGTLTVNSLAAAGTASTNIQVTNNGVLSLQGDVSGRRGITLNGGAISGSGPYTSNNPIYVTGSGTNTLGGSGTITGPITGTNQTITLGTGRTTITSKLLLGTGGLTLNNSGDTSTLQGQLNYSGQTLLKAGYLHLGGSASLPSTSNLAFAGVDPGYYAYTGSGYVYISFPNGQAVLGLGSNFTASLGTGAGQVQWTGNGGFAAVGADISVNVGTNLTWGTGGFVPTGSDLNLASPLATNTVNFTSNIALGNNARYVVVSDGSADVDAILSGTLSSSGTSGAIYKYGSGTLRLTGTNTFSGGIAVNAGTLDVATLGNIGTNSPVGTGKITLYGGTLRFSGTGASYDTDRLVIPTASAINVANAGTTLNLTNVPYSSGEPTLTKTGPGTLGLTGSNYDFFPITVAQGNVNLGKTGSANAADTLTIQAGASATVTGSGSTQVGWLVNNGSFHLNGISQTLYNLAGSSTGIVDNGSTTAATLSINSGSSASYDGAIVNGSTGTLGLSAISGSYTGAIILNGTNTYSGPTTIGGALILAKASAFSPNTNLHLTNYGTLGVGYDFTTGLGAGAGKVQLDTNASVGFASYNGNHSVNLGGSSATLTLGSGFLGTSGYLTFGNSVADGIVDFQNPINFGGGRRLYLGTAPGTTTRQTVGILSGVLSNGTGIEINNVGSSYTVLSTNTFNLGFVRPTANNTFDGPVFVTNSGLEVDRIGNVGSGAGPLGMASTAANGAILLDGGAFRYIGSGSTTDRVFALYGDSSSATTGAILADGTGALKLTSPVQFNTGDYTGTLILGGASTANNELAGGISGSASASSPSTIRRMDVFKQDAGTWVLSGTNNVQSLTVSAGLLNLTGATGVNATTNPVSVTGGILRIGTASLFASSISVTGTGTLQISNPAGFSSSVPLQLTYNSGTPTLEAMSGNFTQTALVTVTTQANLTADAGTQLILDVPSGNAISAAGAFVNFGGAGNILLADPISASSVGYTGTGTLALQTANPISGLSVSSGSVVAGAVGALGSGVVNLGDSLNLNPSLDLGGFSHTLSSVNLYSGSIMNGSLTVTNRFYAYPYGQVQVNATLSGAGSFSTQGVGTVTLLKSNTYSGGTTLNSGTLLADNLTGSATGSGNIAVNATATLGGIGTIGSGTQTLTVAASGQLMGGDGIAAAGTLSVNAALTLNDNSVIVFSLGTVGAHSSLARLGAGTWTFDSDQTVLFYNFGAQAGTAYTGLLTGLASDPGVANWTIANSGWTGQFTYTSGGAPNSGSVNFQLLTVPEPADAGLLLLGFSLAALNPRRSSQRPYQRPTPSRR